VLLLLKDGILGNAVLASPTYVAITHPDSTKC